MAGRKAKCSCGFVNQVPIPVSIEEAPVVAAVVDVVEPEEVGELFEVVDLLEAPLGEYPLQAQESEFGSPANDLGSASNPYSSKNNPYTSPKKSTVKKNQNPLQLVAYIQAGFVGVALLSAIGSVPQQIKSFNSIDLGSPSGVGEMSGLIASWLLLTFGPAVVGAGAICMLRLKNFRLAYLSSIVALIPCITPCIIAGIPFGIWSLALLSKPEVQKKFTS
ncbi:MAG: hypothetical protein AAGA30_06385 [Planctomycetota bacterium]